MKSNAKPSFLSIFYPCSTALKLLNDMVLNLANTVELYLSSNCEFKRKFGLFFLGNPMQSMLSTYKYLDLRAIASTGKI